MDTEFIGLTIRDALEISGTTDRLFEHEHEGATEDDDDGKTREEETEVGQTFVENLDGDCQPSRVVRESEQSKMIIMIL